MIPFNYKPLNKGLLLASFSLKIPCEYGYFVTDDILLFAKGNQRWFSMPSKTYEKDGKKKYFPYNKIDGRKEEFERDVIKLIDKHFSATSGESVHTPTPSTPKKSEDDDLPF